VITANDVRLEAHAEDLNNANMMVANSSGAFLHDFQYFEGKPHRLSEPNFILYWNEEMRSSGYGHMSFFNLKKLVYPLYTGFRNTPFEEDYPANYPQAEAAQKQGAAVTYVHPANSTDFATVGGAAAKELPVDLALGQVDAMDVVSNADEISSMELWYRLLNCGFRLAISAGTDSFTNVADHYTPGGGRVYVHSGNPMRYEDWIGNYKRGRSFASNGPVIFLTVDGKEPGDNLHFPDGSAHKVRVKAIVRTRVPLEKLEIVVNGKPVISSPAKQDETAIEKDITLAKSSWVAARALGPWSRLVLNDVQAFAHTSPVYISVGSKPVASAEDARFWIAWIDRLIAQVSERGRFSTAERRKEVIELFRRAQDIYRKIRDQGP
jgi:TolB protein